MRLRLLLLTAFTSCLLLTILTVAVGPLLQSKVKQQYDDTLRSQVLQIAGYVLQHSPSDADATAYLRQIGIGADTIIGVESPTGAALGPDGPAVVARWPGFQQILQDQPPSSLGTLSPRYYQAANGDRIASLGVFIGSKDWVVEGTVTRRTVQDAQRRRWFQIVGFSALALVLSLLAADLLARRITRPIKAAVQAAAAIGSGNLHVEVPMTGPPEVVELGATLNQLAGRIERLLASERERAANLSHRLRTPLTVLALETESLEPHLQGQPGQLQSVRSSIRALEQGLDDVIRQSQQARTEGLVQECDLVAVIRSHLEFWSPLASAQSRPVDIDLLTGPLMIGLDPVQLGVAFDALLSNIFRHTRPGTGYSVRMQQDKPFVTIIFRDDGRLPTASPVSPAPEGSTGLGLRAATQTIESVGGTLTTETNHGFTAVVSLKPNPWPASRTS